MPIPALSPSVPLRPYQRMGAQSVLDSLEKHRTTLMVMATGLGKTRTAKAIIMSFFEAGMRILWLVDTDDLVWQACEALEDPSTGKLPIDIEKAARKAEPWSPIVVASVQTISNEKRLLRFESDAFDVIIADEAHKSLSPRWARVFGHFPQAKIIGLTATPDRGDKQNLEKIYEDVPFDLGIREAIDDGWLVPLRQNFITVDGLDYSSIRREATKLREGDMEAALLNAEIIERMAIPTRDQIGSRQALVFTCSVDHAYAFAAFMKKIGVAAETVEGDQKRCPTKHRREVIRAYKNNEIQVLTNCAALTTGFDAPCTSAIVFARPILSRALYAQCAGRGTRAMNPQELNRLVSSPAEMRRNAIASSIKSDCLLLDFLGSCGELKLVRAAHALDPDVDRETAELAEKIVSDNQQMTMNEALAIAEEMRAELLKEVGKRDASATHKYQVVEVDPFETSKAKKIFDLLGIQRHTSSVRLPPTEGQIRALQRWKVPDPEVLSRSEASDLLSELKARRDCGLASYRQVELLVNVGRLPRDKVRELTMERAGRGIDKLKENKWKRPEEWGPVKHAHTVA
jgi:superfamily II DNA or RNA helicase